MTTHTKKGWIAAAVLSLLVCFCSPYSALAFANNIVSGTSTVSTGGGVLPAPVGDYISSLDILGGFLHFFGGFFRIGGAAVVQYSTPVSPLSGTVVSANASSNSFVLATPSNGNVTVVISSTTPIDWNITPSNFYSITPGETINVSGTWNAVLKTFQTNTQTLYFIQNTRNIAYGSDPAEMLDFYAPHGKSAPLPALIMIHGGGFYEGSRGEFEGSFGSLPGPSTSTMAELAEAAGFVAVPIDYRLVGNENGTVPNASETDIWPDQIEDAQLAVRFLRANAQTYGIDPNFICATGDSAGAHLAVFLGVLSTIYPGDKSSLYSNESPAVNCVIDNSGPIDFSTTTGGFSQLPGEELVNSKATSSLEEISPVYDVSSTTAPVYITQGTEDVLVPPAQAQELYNTLLSFGVSTASTTYTGGHVFGSLSSTSEQAILTTTYQWAIDLYP